MLPIDPLSLIPESLKTAVRDAAVDFISDQAKKHLGNEVSAKIKKLRSDASFNKKFEQGLEKALKRFANEYAEQDEDLAAAIENDPAIFSNERVKTALLEMLKNPGKYLADEHETLNENFATVLPGRKNRERVDKAISFLLRCLAEELWNLPELQPIYSLQFQRITAESMRQQVELQKTQLRALTTVNEGVRQALLQLTDAIAAKKLLPISDESERPQILHNLPQPDYETFVGREAELAKIERLLHPETRHFVVTVDGIGGIGKSALALEAAHRCLRNYNKIPTEQRFEAIIWTSAKRTVLTADGIKMRPLNLRTLEDIYSTIAITLQREDINRARSEDQPEMVRNALTRQRTLLIVDNLETLDDKPIMEFLHELPAPTKVLITTRTRVDIAYPIRLTGMSWDDAQLLITQECTKKNVSLSMEDATRLFNRTGGVPLAMVFSIAQMGLGYGVEQVLSRLGTPNNDVARFCFEGTLKHLARKPAYNLLMAIAFFSNGAERVGLGYVTELSEMDRDDGLVELEKLSLIDRQGSRFTMLPLTRSFALNQLKKTDKAHLRAGRRWVNYFKDLCEGVDSEYYWKYRSYAFYDDGNNILEAIEWARSNGNADDIFILAYAAYDYLEVTGRWSEIVSICLDVYDYAKSIQNINKKAQLAVARMANILGWIYMQRGDFDDAKNEFLKALEQYRLINSQIGEAITLQHLSSVSRKQGLYELSKQYCDEAWQLAEVLGDGDLKALINTAYGKLFRMMSNWELAWDYFIKVRDWFEKRTEQTPRDEPLLRGNWGHLAIVAYHLNRPQEAKDYCLRSLEFFEKLGTKGYMATLKYRLALIESALGENDHALLHVTEALGWFERLGMKPDHAEALELLKGLQQTNHTLS